MVSIIGGKFVLRAYREDDVKSLVKNINNQKIYRFTCQIPYPYTQKDGVEFISRQVKPENTDKNDLSLAIDIGGQVVGGISFDEVKPNHKAVLGYWLGEDYWGQGIMTEAVKLFCDYGIRELKLVRVEALVYVDNIASYKVLEHNGFVKEGTLKKYLFKDNNYIDCFLMAKVV